MFKNLFVAISLVLGIFLAMIAGVVVASLLPGSGDPEIRVGGMGINVQNVNTSAGASLARRAAALKQVPQVTDAMLREAVAAVMENARRGDVNSATFLFEPAAAQKAEAARQASSTKTAQPSTSR